MQEEAREGGASRLAVSYQELGLGRLTRKVSQQRRGSLANHLRSIYLDAHFVHSVVASYRRQATEGGEGQQPGARASLPSAVFANLRNGEWYAPPEAWDGRVYFKSTDGHTGQWDFSLTRLNLHLALEAARRGGAIVVDSTRRGKAYPDALTYTLPIWAAVLNFFLARDSDEGSPEQQHYLYLPPWVPPSERDRILARLPSLCAKLEAALGTTDGAAFRADLIAAFREGGSSSKPFRPIWIKHGDPLWLLPGVGLGPDEGACTATPLDFIPIVCVSASREREPAEHREHFSWPYVQGAGDDHENWASINRPSSSSSPPSTKGGPLLLTPGFFWAHVRAILPWTTAALPLPWEEGEEAPQEQPRRSGDGEGEEDGVVERRVHALLLAVESSTEEEGGEASTTSTPALSCGRLWCVHEAGLWIGDDACLRSGSRRWGGVVRFVSLDKDAVLARRQDAQRAEGHPHSEPLETAGGGAMMVEEIDEGEGRRGEFPREGLPRAIVAFRRYLCAFASSLSACSPPPFLVVCPTGTAHAPIIVASLLLAHFDETEAGWALRSWPPSRDDGGKDDDEDDTERPYLPDAYHRDRRLGPLNARPPLPRLRALPKLTDKDTVRRALGFVLRALGEDGVVPPARALQKELWSLFSGDTSSGSGSM